MNHWLCLRLVVFVLAAGAGNTGAAYRIEPNVFQAQGFTPGTSNLFPYVEGPYNGLLAPAGDFVPEYSGLFKINVNSYNYFNGNLSIGGNTVPVAGYFNNLGQTRVLVYKQEWDDCYCFYYWVLVWVVDFELIPDTNEIQGRAKNVRQGWETEAFGYRGYRKSEGKPRQEGRHTVSLPGGDDPAIAPSGEGVGTLQVDSRGKLSISGHLADGVAFTQSAYLSTNGWWPFYMSLNDGRGTAIGWIQFDLSATGSLAGDLLWVRPRKDDRRLYPNGFTGTIAAAGSRYLTPGSTQTVLGWTNGVLVLSGGNLTTPLSNNVALMPGGKLIDHGGSIEKLSFSLNKKTGLFQGKFRHPSTGNSVSYSGVMNQIQRVGTGYFLGVDQGGLVRLEEIP